jgi:fumarate reductase flavoprotein subunit
MNASIRLAQEGYRVLMLERTGETGGNSKHSSVFSNFGGHRQAESAQWAYPSYPYDPNNIVEYVLDCQQMTGDPDLLYAMAVEGPRCIDWMNDKAGARWVPMNPSPAGNGLLEWEGMSTPTNGINVNLIPLQLLEQAARDAGVDIRVNHDVQTLVYDGNEVLGVKVETGDGEHFIRANRAVVLTAGGMEVNRAMMSKYSATCLQGIANIATPPNGTGECIRMGQGVGADLAGYDSTGAFDGGVWWREYDEYETMMQTHINKDGNQALRQPWLRINRDGQRVPYLSTSSTSYPYSTDAPPSSAGLCDTAAVEMSQAGGKTFCCFDSKFEQLGLEKGTFVNNVTKWNDACDLGIDYAQTYKYPTEWLFRIDEPPYYGAALGGHVFGSKTGLRVTPQMQVLSIDGKPIKGLYAGWHTAGGSSGDGNPSGKPLTGMYADLGLAFVGGYMVAGGILAQDGRNTE